MKISALFLLLFFAGNPLFAQNKAAADSLVKLGIQAHDEGKYALALEWYDEALKKDRDHLAALVEKALMLHAKGNYEALLPIVQKAVEKHPGEKGLMTAYTTWGNTLDALKRPQKAITVYNQGITAFPDYYALYYNKGIALAGGGDKENALAAFEKAVQCNPEHASSHQAIGQLCTEGLQRVPAVLTLGRFLVLEPQGKRAKNNLALLQKAMGGNVKKTGENSIRINLNAAAMDGQKKRGKNDENAFGPVELLMSLDAALDYDEKNAGKTTVQKFQRRFESVCKILEELRKKNQGFYWSYYVPYFIEMQQQGYTETFSYLAFASADEPGVEKWLDGHSGEIKKFYAWNESYQWLR